VYAFPATSCSTGCQVSYSLYQDSSATNLVTWLAGGISFVSGEMQFEVDNSESSIIALSGTPTSSYDAIVFSYQFYIHSSSITISVTSASLI
jgi:hypothetical protein